MTLLAIDAPGTDGKVTDLPETALGTKAAADLIDSIEPSGRIEQRRGWTYDGTAAISTGDNILSISRSFYPRPQLTLSTAVILDSTNIELWDHDGVGAGTMLGDLTHVAFDTDRDVTFLRRTQYRGYDVICAQDGLTEARFYGGCVFAENLALVGDTVANQSIVTATTSTFTTGSGNGSFVHHAVSGPAGISGPAIYVPLADRLSTTVATMEDFRAASSTAGAVNDLLPLGLSWPCIPIERTGTVTLVTTTVTGTGTRWVNGPIPLDYQDGILITGATGANPTLHAVATIASDTSLTSFTSSLTITNSPYVILRRCPFKEAASHKGSLWGTGVKGSESSVWISPPDCNVFYPPFLSLQSNRIFTPAAGMIQRVNASDFEWGRQDVPVSGSGDPVEALISTSGPLLAPTENHCYQINGAYGSTSVSMLRPGAGCLDKRSAISVEEGQFWVGREGVWRYQNGGLANLCEGRIENEWRRFADDYDADDVICAGVVDGYLVVSATIDSTTRNYRFNLNTGAVSTITNIAPVYMFTSRLTDEPEKLLFTEGDRAADLAPALNGEGIPRDADGTSPALTYTSPANLPQLNSIQKDSRLKHIGVDAVLEDSAGAGSGMDLTVRTIDYELADTEEVDVAVTALPSANRDKPRQFHVRGVGRKGRWHQLRFASDATATTQVKKRLDRVVVDVRAVGRST